MLRAIGALNPDRPAGGFDHHLQASALEEKNLEPVPFLDLTSPITNLRWLDTEFIYFPDIPFALAPKPPADGSSTNRSVKESGSQTRVGDDDSDDGLIEVDEDEDEDDSSNIEPLSRRHLRMVAWVTLEDLLGEGVLETHLLSLDTSQESFLSGEMLSRLLIPWGRHLRNNDHTSSLCSWISTILINAFKEALYILEDLPNTYGGMSSTNPDRLLYLSVITTLFGVAQWANAALRCPDILHLFDDTETREVLLLVLAHELDFRWSQSKIGAQMERILGANISFVAYASTLAPTINRTRTISTNDYVPLHVKSNCSCTFIGPSTTAVIDLLSRNCIPVVAFEEGQLKVYSSTDGPYVAVSHVWADGLGSTTEEGLPNCQILRLSVLIQQLLPNGRFWMDALCVPGHEISRKRAIGLMAKTYQEATKVLVIDGSVRTQCSLSSPREEHILRIATSGWMERIWTLQEGILARELIFEVSDGFIDALYFNGESSNIASQLIPVITHRQSPDASKRAYSAICSNPPHLVYDQLPPLLRHRSTSKLADETLAIAGLLRINAAELVSERARDSRMRKLLLLCREPLPRYLALCIGAKRIQLPNFYWAPLSITEVFWNGLPDALPATCTEEGLYGRYTVIHFGDIQLSWSVTVTVHLEEDNIRTSQPRSSYRKKAPLTKVAVELIFEQPINDFLDFNGVIMMQDSLAPGDGEIPIAAVILQDIEHPEGLCNCLQHDLTHCRFIMSGKMVVHPLPSQTRGWKARMHNLRPILLT